MKLKNNYFLNILVLCAIISGAFYILGEGKKLESSVAIDQANAAKSGQTLSDIIHGSFTHPLPVFILQLITIIVAARLCGYLFKKIGQPGVMGEIVAGILLGPSCIGLLFPQFSDFVFPKASLGNLQMLSQVGLILFMFVIGMELDLNIIRQRARSAMFISYASIIVPYTLGIGLAYFLYKEFAPAHIPFYAFALFMGIAVSITAFPVLARIIKERGLTNTHQGTIAMTSAAVDDVTGWCLLAFVVAIARAHSLSSSVYTILATAVYICIMLFVMRPLLKKLIPAGDGNTSVKQSHLAIIFIVLLFNAYACEIIGIHALFGAFMTGVIMPPQFSIRKLIIDKIEDVALVLLLPLFFVLTGLRTQIGLLNDSSLWMTCAIIIAIAVIGKFGGSAIAAKLSGESTHDSLAIGALMNTRGLMELIVLNIGYDLGILEARMFTMMVLMALITTFMTSPILNVLEKVYSKKAAKNVVNSF